MYSIPPLEVSRMSINQAYGSNIIDRRKKKKKSSRHKSHPRICRVLLFVTGTGCTAYTQLPIKSSYSLMPRIHLSTLHVFLAPKRPINNRLGTPQNVLTLLPHFRRMRHRLRRKQTTPDNTRGRQKRTYLSILHTYREVGNRTRRPSVVNED